MKKTRDIILIVLTVGSLAVFGLLFMLLPKGADMSEEENRVLSSAPSFSDILKSGFKEDLAAYIADRFPMRTTFVKAKAYTELLSGKTENNGVIFASDGYLISRTAAGPSAEADAAKKALDVLAYSENASVPVYFFLTGRTADVEAFRLPALYDTAGDEALRLAVSGALGEKVDTRDLTEELRSAAERGEYVYYKTDHHWTVYGAEYAYRAIVDALGGKARSFDFTVVDDGFLGTTYSAAGLVSYDSDGIALVSYDGIGDLKVKAYVRSADGYTESDIGFYDEDALSAKDKYKAYLYGNCAEVTVRGGEGRQKLLIIKDSYFNCLAPMLAADYDLDIIDPRYMRESDVTAACESDGYAAIVYVYGMETFVG